MLTAAFLPSLMPAQRLDPVKWAMTVEPVKAPPASKVVARVTATIDPGWHLYSLSTPAGGPIPTTIRIVENPAVASFQVYQTKPITIFDQNFKLDTEVYEKTASFVIQIELKKDVPAGPVELEAQSRYQACDNKQCLIPVRRMAKATMTVDPAAAAPAIAIPSGYTLFDASKPRPAASPAQSGAPAPAKGEGESLLGFVLVAFGFGLAAVFTPCVFPMIPITVSFFLSRQGGTRGQGIMQAAVFCLGIVFLFCALGLITTAALGPFGAQQLGSNPWVNAFIVIVFFVFGLSLLGAFEITLPSGFLTKLDRASQGGGVVGALIMGLTFSLTAFACVGPFVGTLLAGSVSGGGIRPLVGMTSFASGLALPFFVLALFPSYLKRLPKSGGWMARVKVVLGFVILAAMFKYLSNIDVVMQWNVLTRERFLAAWVVLFALPGLYLLGFLRMEGVRSDEKVGIYRLLIGTAFLIFSISLVPGMFGAKLGELDAYVPLAAERSNLTGSTGEANSGKVTWMKNQYQEALERGRSEGKLILLSFTGYACTNCHWMNQFIPARKYAALQLLPVELYTDGTDGASEHNQKVLSEKFNTSAIPFYAVVDPDGNVLSSFAGLTRSPEEFISFLRAAKDAKKS